MSIESVRIIVIRRFFIAATSRLLPSLESLPNKNTKLQFPSYHFHVSITFQDEGNICQEITMFTRKPWFPVNMYHMTTEITNIYHYLRSFTFIYHHLPTKAINLFFDDHTVDLLAGSLISLAMPRGLPKAVKKKMNEAEAAAEAEGKEVPHTEGTAFGETTGKIPRCSHGTCHGKCHVRPLLL